MKLNLFKTIRERREQRRRLREEHDLVAASATLDRLMASGVINWDQKQRRMLISEPLAVLMMQTAENWQNFVQNLYFWTYLRQSQKAWEDYCLKEELAAVRKAVTAAAHNGQDSAGEPPSALSRDDIERIKRARRQEIALSEVAPSRVEPFEFFVIPDTTEAVPKPIFVGWFDPETKQQELALWSEVETYLKSE